MIPSELPLPHSSSNLKMSQQEKDDLAQQWHAMMIKDDIDDGNSTLSGLTQSVASRDDLQEQRDPNNRAYQRREAYGEGLLDKNSSYRDNSEGYQSNKGVSKRNETDSNSKTDFLDGIIQSLSELSKGDDKEAKSILQEKKNGWSIHDSQRRMQERRSQRQLHEQKAHGGFSGTYQQSRHEDYESRRAKSAGRSRDRADPIVRQRRSLSRTSRDRLFEESDASQKSDHRSETYSFRNVKTENYSSGNSRSDTYSSGNSRSETHAFGNSGFRQGSRAMAGEPASYSFRKERSWNIDKSLKREDHRSLFDVPTSPESNRTPEESEMILPLDSTSSLGSDNCHFQPELAQQPMRRGRSKPRDNISQASSSASRSSGSRQRAPSLASSSSKDAGKILQHFSIPVSCGPINGAIGGEGHVNRVTEFFEDPIRSVSPRDPRKTPGESYPSRPRSNSSKRGNRSESNPRPSYGNFTPSSDKRIPKTRSQKKLEREILQKVEKEPPISRERRRRSRDNLDTRTQDSRFDDFEAIWGESDDRRATPTGVSKVPNQGTRLAPASFSTNFAPNSVLSQFTNCNAMGHVSSPKASDSNSLSMFEKIQNQLNNRTKVGTSASSNVKSNEEDQRIQSKLDAVRERSIRNAQIVQQMEKEEKLSTNEKFKDFSFDAFGSGSKNLNISKTSEAEISAKSDIKGKRVFDINTDLLEGNKNSAEKRIPPSNDQMKIATPSSVQKNIQDNEISHYMYVAYSQFGDDAQKVLKLCGHHTLPTPDRSKGEILVRVHAATVSPTDCAIRRGQWKNTSMDPYIIPGVALVGKAMGREKKKSRPSSSNIEPGDNVLTLVRTGANARYICLKKSCLLKVPPKLQPERVVCLAETYLTAFQALHLGQRGGMRYRDNCLQGQSILIMNAYTPLGKAIIELSRLAGASICYGLVGDDVEDVAEMHQRYRSVEQWGAIPLSSDPQDWLTLIGRQIDIIITSYDPNRGHKRGNGQITADHWKALKKEGQVHAICSHPGMTELEQRNLILGSTSLNNRALDMKGFKLPSCRPGGREKMADRAVFYNLFDAWEGDRHSKATARKDLEHLIRLLDANLIHPEIAERLPLSKIAKAHRSLDRNTVTGAGHLICSPWLREKPNEQHPKKSPMASYV